MMATARDLVIAILIVLAFLIANSLGVFTPLIPFWSQYMAFPQGVFIFLLVVWAAVYFFQHPQLPRGVVLRDLKEVLYDFQGRTTRGFEAIPHGMNLNSMDAYVRADGLAVYQGPLKERLGDNSSWTLVLDARNALVSDSNSNFVCLVHGWLSPRELDKISLTPKGMFSAELLKKAEEKAEQKILEEVD